MSILFNIFGTTIFSISVFSANVTAKEIEVTQNEISVALNEIRSADFSNKETEDLEDDFKVNLLTFYEEHDSYVSKPLLNDLKDYLKQNDFNFMDGSILSYSSLPRMSLEFDMYEGSGVKKPSISDEFPIYSYNSNNAKVSYAPTINNQPFVGINLTKDAAIGIYNVLSSIIKNFSFFKEILSLAKNTTFLAISSFINKISSTFMNVINTILSLIPAGAIGNIIKVVLVVLISSIVIFLAVAFGFGMFQTGFYIGFKRVGFLNWDFIYGKYE